MGSPATNANRAARPASTSRGDAVASGDTSYSNVEQDIAVNARIYRQQPSTMPNKLQRKHFICPLSQKRMVYPVICINHMSLLSGGSGEGLETSG